jgi:hypothetical protein
MEETKDHQIEKEASSHDGTVKATTEYPTKLKLAMIVVALVLSMFLVSDFSTEKQDFLPEKC